MKMSLQNLLQLLLLQLLLFLLVREEGDGREQAITLPSLVEQQG